MPSDVGLIAALLTKVFGWAVDPDGYAAMKLEHKLEVLHAAYRIAIDQRDFAAADLVFQRLRELSNSIGT